LARNRATTIFHISDLVPSNLNHLPDLATLIKDMLPEAIIVSGVSAIGEDEYLRAGFMLRQLAEKIRVPLSNVVVVPSTRDQAQLRSFSDSFCSTALGRQFSPCIPQVVNLERLQIISVNTIQQGRELGIGEQQFLEWSRLPVLTQATKATRFLVTSLPFARWNIFPQMGLAEWALQHRLFEITTEAISPPLVSIRQFVAEPGTSQVLTFEPDTGFILARTYRRILERWELVDAEANPRKWESHFLDLKRDACYTCRQVALFIAKRTNQWDHREKLRVVLNAVLLLKSRLVLSFPEMSCIGVNGEPICADTLDFTGESVQCAFYGWRWIKALRTYPIVYPTHPHSITENKP